MTQDPAEFLHSLEVLEEHISRAVAAAPPLSASQERRLRALLRPPRDEEPGATRSDTS
jgi:hypothetical protein